MSFVGSPRSSSQGIPYNKHASFLDSAKAHKRFALRAVAIGSVAIGLLFNFTTLMVAVQARNSKGPAIITGIAFIPIWDPPSMTVLGYQKLMNVMRSSYYL